MCSRKSKSLNGNTKQVLEIGARLDKAPTVTLIETAFHKELTDQLGLFDAMNLTDIAHMIAMIESGVVPLESGRDLLGALFSLWAQADAFEPIAARGDLYTNREAWLVEHSPAANWLGTGRARREATTCAFQIKLREDLLDLSEALIDALASICSLVKETRDALMPDYTYLQAAQPTTFGHYLLGFAYPLLRDLDRIRALYARVNRSPAGCGSTNGSRLPVDRKHLANLLGFEGLVTHARDAMWQADLPIETAAILTAVLINLDRLAEDLQIFSTEEFGFVELDDSHARASKIMPQKKNPFALTYIRGVAGTMLGTLASCAVLGRTPSGQPDNRLPIYGIIPRAITDTFDAVTLIAEVISRLRFNKRHARFRLDRSFALASDLAEVLVMKCGMSFRAAHRVVGHLVRKHLPDGHLHRITAQELADTAAELVEQRIAISEDVLRSSLSPDAAIRSRTVTGGAAKESLEMMLVECEAASGEAGVWVEAQRERLESARDGLLDIAREYLATSEAEALC
ncbi:MAG: argininosuccinate lyase [Gammaproteobacteria bacterium]